MMSFRAYVWKLILKQKWYMVIGYTFPFEKVLHSTQPNVSLIALQNFTHVNKKSQKKCQTTNQRRANTGEIFKGKYDWNRI